MLQLGVPWPHFFHKLEHIRRRKSAKSKRSGNGQMGKIWVKFSVLHFTFWRLQRLCSLKNAPRVPSIFFLCLRMFDCIQIADMLKWKQSRTFDRIYYPIEIVSIIQALHRDRPDCFYQFEIVNYSAGSWYGRTQWSNRTAAKLFFQITSSIILLLCSKITVLLYCQICRMASIA